MPRRLLLLLFTLVACTPAPPVRVAPAPPPPPAPQLAATGTASRVVLLSFDGLGADALASQTDLPAFAAMERDGATARIIPVNPTVTASTHVSMVTGAQPQVHGIVANRFHIEGTPPEQIAQGLETEIEAETIVDAARRQGKRVGTVPFPAFDGSTPRRGGDFGMAWTGSLTRGRIVRLARTDFHREWVPPTWTRRPQKRESFSPIMRARIEWRIPERTRRDVDLVAYDTSNDAVENYDLLLIEAAEREIVPDSRGWFALSEEALEGLSGSWSKIVGPDPTLADVTLYWGPISRTRAWPESFRTMLDREIGFWPGTPEERVDVDAATFIEQAERLSDFLTRAQTLTIERMPFDLLLAYQSQVDTTAHNYIHDPAAMRAAFATADRAANAIRAALDASRDALIVTGDHGVAPIDTEVRMNRLLAEHGFAPRWRAYVSGNVAHLYRFDGADDAEALLQTLTASGHFEQLARRTAEMHPHSGDVVAVARPNVLLSAGSDAPAVAKPESSGSHGASNAHRALHTVLFATGAGTPKGSHGEVSQTGIARFVAQLLGIQPPASAE
ncbi:MAG TPA: alkaline phosphatase family protein [Thermoanaerobaculia bacterium]|nr:alkaline phosphatase family protein [Thermoanaerobaculia bacterium]